MPTPKTSQHPMLYKLSSTGKLLQWTTWTCEDHIYTEWGEVDGRLQETFDIIREGKNIGRKNETTPEQQATKECAALWDKKLKSGYCRTAKEAQAGALDDRIAGGIWPMLAHTYEKSANEKRKAVNQIVFPAYVQPKFDGHRSTADPGAPRSIWARSRNLITSVPHINEALDELGFTDGPPDGELYNHDYHDNFEVITHLLKRSEPCPGGTGCSYAKKYGVACPGYRAVQMYVYDASVPNMGFGDRWDLIKDQLDIWSAEQERSEFPIQLVAVETKLVNNHAELIEAYEGFMDKGYEGAIVRNADGPYESKGKSGRSYGLQKVKEFDETEFKITRIVEGRGKHLGQGMFKCDTAEGYEFECKMSGKGKKSELEDYWNNPDKYIGRVITVQHQGLTGSNKPVPRFPVGLRFREDL